MEHTHYHDRMYVSSHKIANNHLALVQVPKLWSGGDEFSFQKTKLYELLCIYALRPDRFTAAAQRYMDMPNLRI